MNWWLQLALAPILATVGTAQSTPMPLPGAAGRGTPAPYVPEYSFLTQFGAENFPGGEASQDDYFLATAPMPSGGIIVAGGTYGSLGEPNAGGLDAVVTRLNAAGEIVWVTQIGSVTAPTIPELNGQPGRPGGDASGHDLAVDVFVDADGTILLTGNTSSSLGENRAAHNDFTYDIWTARMTGDGELVWLHQLGIETANSIVPAKGATVWGDASFNDGAFAIAADPSGGFWVAAVTGSSLNQASTGNLAPLLARYNDSGQLLFVQQVGEVHSIPGFDASEDNLFSDMVLTRSGPLVAYYQTYDGRGYTQSWGDLLLFDPSGVPQTKLSVPNSPYRQHMTTDSAGRVYLVGSHDPFEYSFLADVAVAFFDPSVPGSWVSSLVDASVASAFGLLYTENEEAASAISIGPSGEVVVAGSTTSWLDEHAAGQWDLFTMKFDPQDASLQHVHQLGQETAQATGRDLFGSDYCNDMFVAPDGAIIAVGRTTGSPGEPTGGGTIFGGDGIVVRLRSDGTLD